jgi:hypothetical protein
LQIPRDLPVLYVVAGLSGADRLGLAFGTLNTRSKYCTANMGSGRGADDLKFWGLRAKLAY